MRNAFVLLFAAAGLGCAFSVQKLPLPPGVQLGEADLAMVHPGLLSVVSSYTKAYQTSDLGGHWDSIPLPAGSGFESEGIALTSSDSRRIWNGNGWIDASLPSDVASLNPRWIMADVDNVFAMGYVIGDTTVLMLRSRDSLRTWQDWFGFSARNAPQGIDLGKAEFAGCRIWLDQSDSARWQSTADGWSWTAIPYPPGCMWAEISSASGDSLLALAELVSDSSYRFARSSDGGAHWTLHPTDQPGAYTMPAPAGSWISVVMDIDRGKFLRSLYASPSPEGPWTLVSSSDPSGMVQDDAVYFVDTTGLYRADLSGLASIAPRVTHAQGLRIVRSGDGFVAELDGNRPRRWSLARADGSILASGRSAGSFAIPSVAGGAYLSIEGMGVRRLPPF
jgi:hypothetical protein